MPFSLSLHVYVGALGFIKLLYLLVVSQFILILYNLWTYAFYFTQIYDSLATLFKFKFTKINYINIKISLYCTDKQTIIYFVTFIAKEWNYSFKNKFKSCLYHISSLK